MSKLDGNGLYESSRFIMPEHQAAVNNMKREQARKEKPILDEQEWNLIGAALMESLQAHHRVTLILYDPYQEKQLSGFVTGINTYLKEIKLREGDELHWIKFKSILSATIN